MMLTHNLTLDLLKPEIPARIQVKQGDTLTHSLHLVLLAGGEAWPIPVEATPVVRWFAFDPDSGESARGIYDTLPDGTHAWNFAENQLDLLTVREMFALPGVVQTDVVFVAGEKTLATVTFEFYVNRVPADGTEPEIRSYYKVATLEQINEALALLQEAQADCETALIDLEREIYELKRLLQEA